MKSIYAIILLVMFTVTTFAAGKKESQFLMVKISMDGKSTAQKNGM